MYRCLLGSLTGFLLLALGAHAQPAPTPATARLAGFEARDSLRERSLVRNVELTSIGPTVMSGRVVDVDVNPDDPTHLYVAYASGGLWRSTNNGLSFEPLFDDQAAMALGDIAVDWARGTLWVGTGENNSSRSSYAGTGVYKSTDGGASWQHMGLGETHRTGRIVLHPTNPDVVWVAALGALYTPSPHRGVYKTTDGGATWRLVLPGDSVTGAVDLVRDPANPDVLYAALWHRERRAWDFVESGPGSGIFKSTDGGETWQRLNTPESGFPTGPGVGRIGLAVFPGNPRILYALLDNQNRRPEEPPTAEAAERLTRDQLRTMSRDAFLQLSTELIEQYLRTSGFPAAYTAQSVLAMVREGKIEPIALVEFLEDANAQLFDTPVIGAELYRSDDAGRSWRRTHDELLDDLYYSYGYYFGQVAVAPDSAEKVYIMGVPILKSADAGKTFVNINEPNVHVDHHALWVNPRRPDHLVNGNDGGLNISYDEGKTWFKANTPSVGQFYAVAVDEATPYNVYGGLQDNGVWKGPHRYRASYAWYADGDYPYDMLLGGDGMQVEVDTRTNETVYTGFQFGNYFRLNRATRENKAIQPKHALGERPLRFNWQTPIHLSRHNQDILYLGSNFLHRSLNRGDDWTKISPDLTQGGRPGDVPFGTLSTIDESPLRFGLLYTGSDDGLVHVSRDGGASWQRVSDGLPQGLWVSRVEASNHAEGRVYVTLNGYRNDHFDAYLYRSDDYGQTWTRLGVDLPAEPVNVVLEDPANASILYVGTDHGLYVSVDGGARFMTMMHGLPNVPVHDLKVQAREKHLIVGTHGRSIYRADLAEVQQLTPALLAKALHLFPLAEVSHRASWGSRGAPWSAPTRPSLRVPYFSDAAGEVTLRVLDAQGRLLATRADTAEHGLNYAAYDLTFTPPVRKGKADDPLAQAKAADDGLYYLPPGTYTVELSRGTHRVTGTFEVKAARRPGGTQPLSIPGEPWETVFPDDENGG